MDKNQQNSPEELSPHEQRIAADKAKLSPEEVARIEARRGAMRNGLLGIGAVALGMGLGNEKKAEAQIDTKTLLDTEAQEAEKRVQELDADLKDEEQEDKAAREAADERVRQYKAERQTRLKKEQGIDENPTNFTWEAFKPVAIPTVTNILKAGIAIAHTEIAKSNAGHKLETYAQQEGKTKEDVKTAAVEQILADFKKGQRRIEGGKFIADDILVILNAYLSLNSIIGSDATNKTSSVIGQILGTMTALGLINGSMAYKTQTGKNDEWMHGYEEEADAVQPAPETPAPENEAAPADLPQTKWGKVQKLFTDAWTVTRRGAGVLRKVAGVAVTRPAPVADGTKVGLIEKGMRAGRHTVGYRHLATQFKRFEAAARQEADKIASTMKDAKKPTEQTSNEQSANEQVAENSAEDGTESQSTQS